MSSNGWIAVALLLCVFIGCEKSNVDKSEGKTAEEGRVSAARTPIDGDGRLSFHEDDRCPVCAMKVSEHERFACGIQLKDGTTYHFCASGCMMRT